MQAYRWADVSCQAAGRAGCSARAGEPRTECDKAGGPLTSPTRAHCHSAQTKKQSRAGDGKQGQPRARVSGQVHSDEQVRGETGKSSQYVRISKGRRYTRSTAQGRPQVWTQLPSEEATEEAPHSSFHCSSVPGYVSTWYRSQPHAQVAKPPGSGEGAARSQRALTALTRAPANSMRW